MERRTLSLAAGIIGMLLVSQAALAQYQLTNLVSNQVGWAKHVDPLLVNAWGLTRSAKSPYWISDAGSGWSTLYNGNGIAKSLKVVIPSASGAGPGSPTGIVFNGSSEFQVGGWTAFFIFATLDGTISGWAPQSNFNEAIQAVDNSANKAVYTGLAITIGAILTLFVMMQMTGRTRWSDKTPPQAPAPPPFASASMPPPPPQTGLGLNRWLETL